MRSQMSVADREAAGIEVSRRVIDLATRLEAKVVHVFWPIEKNFEIDTRPVIRQLVNAGTVVALPVVSSLEDGVMQQRRFVSESELAVSRFGSLEPVSGPLVSPEETGLIVAPALAADRRGFRIGYGGGFYDRFLATTGCPSVVVVYSECLIDRVPEESHDVPVDFVITEFDTIVTEELAT